MSKLRALTAALFLLCLSVFTATTHASTQDFTISSFDADYTLSRDAQNVPHMHVQEVIAAVFPDFDQNHGILRAIPSTYKNQPMDVQVTSVLQNDVHAIYNQHTSNGNVVLRIGDSSIFVHGTQYYTIAYDIKNPVSFFNDHDELYWNVNGTQWQQPFAQVKATMHIPAYLASSLQERQVCYTGTQGSNAQDCTISRDKVSDGSVTVNISANDLAPGGNLSFVLAFDKGTFAPDKAAQQARIVQWITYGVVLLLLPIITALVMLRAWNKYGKDAKGRGTIVPQYVPLKELDAMLSDVVMQEKLRNNAVTAQIIELAVRGYISVSEITTDKLIGKKTDYTLTLIKSPSDLSEFERQVVEMFFSDFTVGSIANIKELKNTMSGDFKRLSNNVPESMATLGYFKRNPVKAVSKFRVIGWTIIFFLIYIGRAFAWNTYADLFLGSLVISGIILLIFSRYMSARTDKGVEAFEYLKGLKMFIEVAEADRIKYLQSPEGVKQWGDPKDPQTKIKLFEKLLPYAMIFGLEKNWAKEFDGIYKQAPGWYNGNMNNFTTGYLIGSIGNLNTVSAAAFAPPHSSGSSGFGGGGFSGGGGGGGGGGGW